MESTCVLLFAVFIGSRALVADNTLPKISEGVGISNGKSASISQYPYKAECIHGCSITDSDVDTNDTWILTTDVNVNRGTPGSLRTTQRGQHTWSRGGGISTHHEDGISVVPLNVLGDFKKRQGTATAMATATATDTALATATTTATASATASATAKGTATARDSATATASTTATASGTASATATSKAKAKHAATTTATTTATASGMSAAVAAATADDATAPATPTCTVTNTAPAAAEARCTASTTASCTATSSDGVSRRSLPLSGSPTLLEGNELPTRSERVGISNGKNASISQYPFMAARIHGSGVEGDSGVIWNESWILTTKSNENSHSSGPIPRTKGYKYTWFRDGGICTHEVDGHSDVPIPQIDDLEEPPGTAKAAATASATDTATATATATAGAEASATAKATATASASTMAPVSATCQVTAKAPATATATATATLKAPATAICTITASDPATDTAGVSRRFVYRAPLSGNHSISIHYFMF